MWPWIGNELGKIEFNTVLDLFGGSGAVSFGFQQMGKNVVYNDLQSHLVAIAKGVLQATSKNYLEDISWLWNTEPNENLHKFRSLYPRYFFRDELDFLDRFVQNLHNSNYDDITRGLLWYIISQAALDKRPQGNYQVNKLRLREKSDGNQRWDRKFEELVQEKVHYVNSYIKQFNERTPIKFKNMSSSELDSTFLKNNEIDFVYLDPPFLAKAKKSRQLGNYIKSYHINEFMINYYSEPQLNDSGRPDPESKLMKENRAWVIKHEVEKTLRTLIENIDTPIALSYRAGSMISKDKLLDILPGRIIQHNHIYKIPKQERFDDILIIRD